MKKFRIAIIFIAIMLALAVFTSCNSNESYDGYASNGEVLPEAGDSVGVEKGEDSEAAKIIKNATVNAETKDFEDSADKLKTLINSVGGNIANSNSTVGTSYHSSGESAKRANYTIKVPSEKFEEFLAGLEELLNVTYITTSTEDVTENYLTVEAKIESLEAQRKGLVDMLESVDLSKDFYTWQQIKNELSAVETQLNYYHNVLQGLDKVTRYSTVTLTVEEVVELTVLNEGEESFWQEIGNAFKGSFSVALEFFKGLIIVLIYLLPFGIVLGSIAVAVVIFVVLVRRSNKKRAKRAEEAAKNAPKPMPPQQNMPYGPYNDPNRKN